MISCSIGNAKGDQDAFSAGAEAAKMARAGLGTSRPSAAIVFASVAIDQDRFLEGVASVLPGVPLAGCSTAGEITTDGLSEEGSGVVMLFVSDQCAFSSTAVHHVGSRPKASGAEFSKRAREISPTGDHALVFADPFGISIEEFLSGLAEGDPRLQVTGAAAGDDLLYRETFQYRDTAAHARSVTGMLISGNCRIATAITRGFIPVGMPAEITTSEGNVIVSIDDKPAVDLYASYFGHRHIDLLKTAFAETTTVYPLGIRMSEGHHVEIPIALLKDGGLECIRHVPEGSEVRLMVGDIDATIEGAKEAARQIVRSVGGRPLKALIIFSSIARKRLLGRRADEEVRAVQDVVGRSVPIAGLYEYAEILGTPARMAQASMVLWGIAE